MEVKRIRIPLECADYVIQHLNGNFLALDVESGVLPIGIDSTFQPTTWPDANPEAYIDDSPQRIPLPIGTVVRYNFRNRIVLTTPYITQTAPPWGADELTIYYGVLRSGETFELPKRRFHYDFTTKAPNPFIGGATTVWYPKVRDVRKLQPIERNSGVFYCDFPAAVPAAWLTLKTYAATSNILPVETVAGIQAFSSSFVLGYRFSVLEFTNTLVPPVDARPHMTGRIAQ